MAVAGGGQGRRWSSRSPWPGRRARRWSGAAMPIAPRHQDLAVGQQGGRVASSGPWPGSRWWSRLPWPGRRARRWPGRQRHYSPPPPGPCRWAAGWRYGLERAAFRDPVFVQVAAAPAATGRTKFRAAVRRRHITSRLEDRLRLARHFFTCCALMFFSLSHG